MLLNWREKQRGELGSWRAAEGKAEEGGGRVRGRRRERKR